MSNESWQYDWPSFARKLEECTSHDNWCDGISLPFAGREVVWEGVLRDIDLDPLAPGARVDLQPLTIKINNTLTANIDRVALSFSPESLDEWSEYRSGQQVRFQARFGNSRPFAAISIRKSQSGKIIVLIGLNDAIPIES